MTATLTEAPIVVDLYARLSMNPNGELEKIDTQLDDCRRQAERQGWRVGQVHIDNSLSAWKRGVRRPGWEALLRRLQSGATGGVVVYHQDRLLRQPRDLERLLDLAAQGGLKLASAHGTRDLTNPDDVFIVRIEVAHACRSSDDHSRRMCRRTRTMRENGVSTGGRRRFGFELRNEAHRPDEAALIVRAAADVLAGHSATAVARQWNSLGYTTVNGNAWTGAAVRNVLTAGRNAALIEHQGEIVGPAAWEPILDRDVFDGVRAALSASRDNTPQSSRVKALLSSIATCGKCGATVKAGVASDGRRRYKCSANGHLSRALEAADEYVALRVVALLADPVQNLLGRKRGEQAAAIQTRLQALRARKNELGSMFAEGEIDASVLKSGNAKFKAQIAEAERELADLSADTVLAGVAGPDAQAKWETLPIERQRAIIAHLADVVFPAKTPVGAAAQWGRRPSVQVTPRHR